MRVLLLCLLAISQLSAASVWLEGESAVDPQVQPHPQWYDQVNAEALSGGDWLSHFSYQQVGSAGYALTIPSDGRYRLWLRANYHSARLSFRIDDGAWQKVDFVEQTLRGRTLVSGDRQLDIRFLAWAAAGEHQLTAGDHRLELRFHSENHNHGAIDCLVLTTLDWKPFGTDRPPQ
jgi:hypothetical protein